MPSTRRGPADASRAAAPVQFASPLRHRVAQSADQQRQARAGQRRVLANDHVDQRVDARRRARRVARAGPGSCARVDADACVAPDDAQQPAVVHRIEQMRRRVRGAAPVVGHRAVREVRVDLARVHRAALAHELEQRRARFVLRSATTAIAAARAGASALHGARHEAVVDEEVLFDVERVVPPLEVAGPIAARDGAASGPARAPAPDRVRLHEAQVSIARSSVVGGKRVRATANRRRLSSVSVVVSAADRLGSAVSSNSAPRKSLCYRPVRKHHPYDSTVPGRGHPGRLPHREMVVRPPRTTGGRRRNGRRLDAWALVFRMADASSVVRTLCGADAAVSECAQPTRTGVVHVSGWAALGGPT